MQPGLRFCYNGTCDIGNIETTWIVYLAENIYQLTAEAFEYQLLPKHSSVCTNLINSRRANAILLALLDGSFYNPRQGLLTTLPYVGNRWKWNKFITKSEEFILFSFRRTVQ